jgi:hypothetical protein
MKSLAKSQLVHAENCSPKEDGISVVAIGAVMRSEKIDNAQSIASAIRRQRQEQQAPTPTSSPASSSIMRKALLERLETKLLANELECTELRKLTEARKRGIPVSLASLDLPENGDCDNDVLLQKLEALVLEKENKCTKVRKLLAEARKRDSPKCCVSPSTPMKAPASILRPQASPRSGNSVTWGVNCISL